MEREPQHFVQSLARGLSILQAFSSQRPKLTLTDLADLTGMNKTATQRYTDTLVGLGFLGRNRHKAFSLGPRVLSLGFAYLQGSPLRQLAATYLSDFVERSGLTTNLSILEGTEMVFLYRKETHRFLKFDLRAGSRLPSHCTSAGKVLLASLEDGDLRARIGGMRLERMTSHTITDQEVLFEEIRKTRERGYGIADKELTLALCSIAVPVLDMEGRVIAALNVGISSEDAHGEVLEHTIRQVVDQGRQLSVVSGYQGEYPVIPARGFAGDEP